MFKIILAVLIVGHAHASSDALVAIGEELFNDPKFSRDGDFACLTCHQVDAQFDPSSGLGMRTYADFTPRTKVPLRLEDKVDLTLRNTPGLVGIGSPYNTVRFSHWDGEFADHSETVLGNFAGRNMGWLSSEKSQALENIVSVVRTEYDKYFLGVDPSLPDEMRLPPSERVDVHAVRNSEVIEKVVSAVTAYLNDLDFEKDENDQYIGAPYDQFLKANNLPTAPVKKQSNFEYMIELRQGLLKLQNPKFIVKKHFSTHGKEFGFGPKEWAGLKVFFNLPKADGTTNRGMCLSCHHPPLFTDEQFHNVGVTQLEYDRVHGSGSFKKLPIPDLDERGAAVYNKRPSEDNINDVDLGVWNFFGRMPEITRYMAETHCRNPETCDRAQLLKNSIGKFKTPGLRNLNMSAPYFHNGSSPHLYHLLHEYKRASEIMQKEELRNGDVRLRAMRLFHHEIHSLVPFLESLNEEYE